MVRPLLRLEMSRHAVTTAPTSIRHACDTFAISGTCYRCLGTRSAEHDESADWSVRLIATYRARGLGLFLRYLRNVNAFGWNDKRV